MANAEVNQVHIGDSLETQSLSSEPINYTKHFSNEDVIPQNIGSFLADNSPDLSKQLEKHKKFSSNSKDFRETPKYHDIDSYVTQRHHFIGTGVFNADELDDLPPRFRTKVLNAYEVAAADLAARYPQASVPTVADLLAIGGNNSSKSSPEHCSSESHFPNDSSSRGSLHIRGQRGHSRGQNISQRGHSRDIQVSHTPYNRTTSSNRESYNHPSCSNQDHTRTSNFVSDFDSSIIHSSRGSSHTGKYTYPDKREYTFHDVHNQQDVPYSDPQLVGYNEHPPNNTFKLEPFDKISKSNASQSPVEQNNYKKANLEKSAVASSKYCSIPASEKLSSAQEFHKFTDKLSKQSFQNENHRENEPSKTRNRETDETNGFPNKVHRAKRTFKNGNHRENKPTRARNHELNGFRDKIQSAEQTFENENRRESESTKTQNGETDEPNEFRDKGHPVKQTFKNENRRENESFKTRNIGANYNQGDNSKIDQKNSFKKIEKEGLDKFSNINKSAGVEGNTNLTISKANVRNPPNKNNRSEFQSGNVYENRHHRTISQTSSASSDKTFHDNKRNKSIPIDSSQSCNTLHNPGDKKANKNGIGNSSNANTYRSFSPNDRKHANNPNTNFSDHRTTGIQNTSLQCPDRIQNTSLKSEIEGTSVDSIVAPKTTNTAPTSPSKNFGKSTNYKRNFKHNQGNVPGFGDQKHFDGKDSGSSRQSITTGDESMKSVMDVIYKKEREFKGPCVGKMEMSQINKGPKRTQCEAVNEKYTVLNKNGDNINHTSNTRYNRNGNSTLRDNSKSLNDNLCQSKPYNRANSQNSNSSQRYPVENRTYDKNVSSNCTEVSSPAQDTISKRVHKNSSSGSYSKSNSSDISDSKGTCYDKNFDGSKQIERAFVDKKSKRPETSSSANLENSSKLISNAHYKQRNSKETGSGSGRTLNKCEEKGFFVHVNVSESSNQLEVWQTFFQNVLKHQKFVLEYCCEFTESLILNFEEKPDGLTAVQTFKKLKQKVKDIREPHIILVSNMKTRLIRPCNCEDKIVESCLSYFKEFSQKYIKEHQRKITEVENELKALHRTKNKKFLVEHELSLNDTIISLRDMESVFKHYVGSLEEEVFRKCKNKALSNYFNICQLKSNFSRECNSFKRGLPIYSRKEQILDLLSFHSVTVLSAETGSGKSTQLTEYLLQSWVAERGTIICTQPRKMAAISITNFVCGQIGTAVGKLIGYDVGIEKKYDKDTKIIYMTDYALLKKFLRNRRLKGISCVIIDEAHERTLYTDLLLGMLKDCVRLESDRLDFRIVITSATIDPAVFVRYFNFSPTAVISVPGRTYPVEVIWLEDDVQVGWSHVKASVKTAVKVHIEEPKGDILVFLTSPSEIDESILMFKDLYSDTEMPLLMSLHGKSDLQEQMLIFQTTPGHTRKIIFATNAAETSLTIPGVKYVIDCGFVKEMMYYPEKNKNCLVTTFINKSSAEQRKGRAGRTQPGVCYRMYSRRNFEDMPERPCPEILKTNLQKALMKIYEFGIKPDRFDFIESPSEEAIAKSIESLEHMGLIENGDLTALGRKAVELPVDPRLSKLVLQGIAAGIGYEMAIIAAMESEAGRVFLRSENTKSIADEKKVQFCLEGGDLCTYLEVYKRWHEIARNERFDWCVQNFINSKALNSAAKTVEEIIICLRLELSIHVMRRYNNSIFKAQFESIIFNCFSENLCIFSGHPKVGYFSPYLKDCLFIHPSTSLSYLGTSLPHFLVYSTLTQTSRNFLLGVTPVKERTINKAYQSGSFKLQTDMLKCLKIFPKTLGPFGDSVLKNCKNSLKMDKLKIIVEKLINSRNYQIDILNEKGTIVIYLEKRFHEKISRHIYDIVKGVRDDLTTEEHIVKMTGGFAYFCLGAGGIISDIIMPGEFKEIIIENLPTYQLQNVETSLKSFGDLKAIRTTEKAKRCQVSATYMKVSDALNAKLNLSQKGLNVRSKVFVQESCEKALPIYRVQVSWSRSLSDGTGWVAFDSEADCIAASGCLTTSSFYMGKNYIRFTPSNLSVKELAMRNLPPIIEERTIRDKLTQVLPSLISVKTIYIKRKILPPVTENDILSIKKKLTQQFGRFTSSSKMVIDVEYPKLKDPSWNAVVYFESPEDGERASKELDGKTTIDSFSCQIKAIRKSHLFCKKHVFKALKKEIDRLERECKETVFSIDPNYNSTMVDIGFSCKNMEDFFAVRQKLVRLLQGSTIQCFGNQRYFHLFTMRGERLVKEIENQTKTFITLDNPRKIISIYGPKKNCARAEVEIRLLGTNKIVYSKKVYNLNSSMPAGFLKCLYVKYGIDFQGLISDFNLNGVKLDAVKGTLTLEGPSTSLNKVEDHLEEICNELYNKHQGVKSDDPGREICAVCLDPLYSDCYRLENCGHAFCKDCLQLQVESKTVPLVCITQNCGKPFFISDIKILLSRGGENLKKNFFDAALQYHVNCNIGKISYCPTPDCHMVYRVSSSGMELHCPGCENTICTHCQTPYHYGMSCDMFKNCIEDEDYSLKVWMEENPDLRKQCPNCKAVIEKESGCNHMECFNCRTHLCWLCLEIFSTGDLVYDHLPYCPKNQVENQ